MKLSISLPAEEIAFMDGYARSQGIKSRLGRHQGGTPDFAHLRACR